MRRVPGLELIEVLACFVLLVRLTLIADAGIWLHTAAALVATLLAAQLYLEPRRAPALPAYVLAVAAAGAAAPAIDPALAAAGLLLLYAMVASGFVAARYLAAPALPPSSGWFRVGTDALALPPLPAGHAFGSAVAPAVRVWFPRSERARRHPLLRCRHPVLLYFPGWPGRAPENRALVRELASHGYVVAAAEYPPARALDRLLAEPFLDCSSARRLAESVSRNDERVRVRALDALAILDRLAVAGAGDGDGVLAGRIDARRAGIFGYSLGGAVAAQACRLDRRFAAAVNIDGLHFGEAARLGVEQPYLLISDDATAQPQAADPRVRSVQALARQDHEQAVANLARHGGYLATVAGAQHATFGDAALRARFRRRGDAGAIDPLRAHEIVAAYVLAFFARHLQGEDSPLLSGNCVRYPEIQLRVWDRATRADAAASVGSIAASASR